jgi:hypothetical protein
MRNPQEGLFYQIASEATRQTDLPRPMIPSSVAGTRRMVAPRDKPIKPFDPAKNTWERTGSEDSSQMAYLMERLMKLEERHKKAKKRAKKRARDSSDIDSDGY